jgi:hypothetical protein
MFRMGSGYPYPVPWHLIPANIYINVRFIYSVLFKISASDKVAYLKSMGITKPFFLPNIYNERYRHISAGSLAADFPLTSLPKHVVPCGPIFLSTASAAQQDPELADWLLKRPTVLINLGSIYTYTELAAREMATALDTLFETTNCQVLWKFNKRSNFSDDFLGIFDLHLTRDRIRLETWLATDPAALMETGNVVVSVNHGGASSYHEAVG